MLNLPLMPTVILFIKKAKLPSFIYLSIFPFSTDPSESFGDKFQLEDICVGMYRLHGLSFLLIVLYLVLAAVSKPYCQSGDITFVLYSTQKTSSTVDPNSHAVEENFLTTINW